MKPANVAFENDFYQIDLPGIDVDEIEKAFWELEGEAARVLKKIIHLELLPAPRKDYAISNAFYGAGFCTKTERPGEFAENA